MDTLRELRAERGAAAPLALLVGADSFRSLPTWKHWRQLPELAHFIVAGRDSDGDAPLSSDLAGEVEGRWTDDPAELAARPAGRVYALRQPLRAESATAVRRAIAEGDPAWPDQVPPEVEAWIRTEGLYRRP